MQIITVDDKRLIRKFVEFPDMLYADDPHYVPYMKADLTRTLRQLLLRDKSYFALLAVDGERVLGRVLCTISRNKQLDTDKCGFFSMFECVHDQTVCDMMLGEATRRLREMGATHLSGTYFPYDQDNRRGILVEGFERAPLIFTSYNKTYYDSMLTRFGLMKHADTLEYKFELADVPKKDKVARVAQYAQKRFRVHVDTVNWRQVDKDIADLHTVMEAATTEAIYQDAPGIDALNSIVKNWRRYLEKDYILIARSDETGEPLGVVVALPDFFDVFRKMRGETNIHALTVFAKARKHITSARAILQYVIPKYQAMGVAMALYFRLFQNLNAHGVDYVECGTMMEDNPQPNDAIRGVGGELARRYRIYYKEI